MEKVVIHSETNTAPIASDLKVIDRLTTLGFHRQSEDPNNNYYNVWLLPSNAEAEMGLLVTFDEDGCWEMSWDDIAIDASGHDAASLLAALEPHNLDALIFEAKLHTGSDSDSPIDGSEAYEYWARRRSLDLDVDEILALRVVDVPAYCEGVLDTSLLIRDLTEESLPEGLARKAFCQYLDIAQSTLSGWLRQQRVPRMAKEAYVLLKTLLVLQNEIKRMKEQQPRNNVAIVNDGGKYQLIKCGTDNTGAIIGTIMAKDIPDEASARVLAESSRALELLREFHDQLSREKVSAEWFRQLDYQFLRNSLTAFGFQEWEKRFLPNYIRPQDAASNRAWEVLAEVDRARAQSKLEPQTKDDSFGDVPNGTKLPDKAR